MRIAYFAYDRPGYHAGPIINARRLLPELRKRGQEPIGLFMYQDGGAPTVDYLRSQGIECRLRHNKGNTEERIRWFLDQIADIKPDVFVPNISIAGWFASRWVRAAGIPTIAAMRNDDPFYWDMVSQFVVGDPSWAVSGLVSVAQDLSDRVEQYHPQHTKLEVIPSGVPCPPKPVSQLQPLRLTYLGRLEDTPKNVLFLAEVMCEVLKEMPDATGQFLGKGTALTELQRFVISQGMEHRFDFPGSVLPENLTSHLSGSSVVLLASDHEGTPGALMDAMSHGLVPVCTATPGGVKELVRPNETGLIVEKRVESFVAAIRQLSLDPVMWEKLSSSARNVILEKYSLASTTERWISFCEALLRDAGPQKPIKQPLILGLPAVLSAHAAEDNRYVGTWQKMVHFASQKAKGLKRRLAALKVGQR